MLLHPMRQTDVFYFVEVFLCLPTFTFQLLCFLVLPSSKTQRPQCAELSYEYLTTRHHTCKKRVIPVIYHRKFFWIFRKILG